MNETIALAIVILSFFTIGLTIGMVAKRRKGIVCSVHVTSKNTGIKYHASKYYITKDDELELLIYNHVSSRYEWYPIWHFENPFIIAYTLNSNYAMNHWYKYMLGAQKVEELTKAQK